jgi:hypothetical protein
VPRRGRGLHAQLREELGAYAPVCEGDGAEEVQVEYFNQRRVLAERQKGMLAQAANQAKDAARR